MSSFDELRQQERQSSQTRSGRATDVRGGYSNPRPAGDTSGLGRPADFGSAGGNAQGTPRKTYTARAKYTEYLDNFRNLEQIAKRGVRQRNIMGRDTIVFSRREDELAYQSENANVSKFEDDNTQCDGGDSGACQRAGRGSAPTEYASPFSTSIHFNDVAYFGGGGRQLGGGGLKTKTEATNTPPTVDARYARTGVYAYEGESNGARANRLIREARALRDAKIMEGEVDAETLPAEPPYEADQDDAEGGADDINSRTPVEEGVRHNTVDGSGGGDAPPSGADGSATHGGNTDFEPLPPANTSGVSESVRPSRSGFDFVDSVSVYNRRCF